MGSRGKWSAVIIGWAAATGTATAQTPAACSTHPSTTVIRETAPLERPPEFGPGERLSYAVSVGKVHAGSASMQLLVGDTIRGRPTWRATLVVSGGFWKFSVHDSTASWFDPRTFTSYRFAQEVRDPGYRASRLTEIYPERGVFHRRGDVEKPTVADPMDDVSFLYFARSLPLEPGQCYELRRYFRPEGNPVVIRVVKRDTVTVPAGRFPALLLQPEITTSGMFSKDGHAELWVSDDAAHLVLQLKTKLSRWSINLYLDNIERPSGTPR
jgi:hypothetical protein